MGEVGCFEGLGDVLGLLFCSGRWAAVGRGLRRGRCVLCCAVQRNVTYPEERERDLHELETVYQRYVGFVIIIVMRSVFTCSDVRTMPLQQMVDLKRCLRRPDEREDGRERATNDQRDVIVLIDSQKNRDSRVSSAFLDCLGLLILTF